MAKQARAKQSDKESKDTKKAAVYLRISKDPDMDGLAIDRQREDCMQILRQRGWELYDEYVDQSVSAYDKTKHRKDYERMVQDFKADKFQCLVCWDIDRLTRQPAELEWWIDAAQTKGLLLVTANGEADLTTDNGILFAGIKAQVARAEVMRKSARQKRAYKQRAKAGKTVQPGTRAMGYNYDGTVNETEASVVRTIFEDFRKGAALSAIARALSGDKGDTVPDNIPQMPTRAHVRAIESNQRRKEEKRPLLKVPTSTTWDPSTVRVILRNPRYAGYASYCDCAERNSHNVTGAKHWKQRLLEDDKGNYIRGEWTPLIDEDTWLEVQGILDEPTRRTAKGTYSKLTGRRHQGSGLYVCGICGHALKASTRSYVCQGTYDRPHARFTRGRPTLDAYVNYVIEERLSRPDFKDLLPSKDEPRIKEIKSEIESLKRRVARAERDYDNEDIEARDLKRIREKNNGRIEELKHEQTMLLASSRASEILDSHDPAKAFRDADIMHKRFTIDTLCTVRVFPGHQHHKEFDPETVDIEWKTE